MRVTEKDVVAFGDFLCMEERSPATVEKYLRDIRQFLGWIGKRPISKAEVACWKEELSSKGYFATTINGKLVQSLVTVLLPGSLFYAPVSGIVKIGIWKKRTVFNK